MDIIKPNVRWNPDPTDKFIVSKIDGIGLHHMAHPTWDFNEVHAYHRDTNKWRGIAYNWWIGFDGKIYEGRGWYYGAGIKGHNTHVVSIGFQGNYEPSAKMAHQESMPDAQFNAGVELIKWLRPQLPNVRVIHGHKYWTSTSCPGKFFPLAEMVTLQKRGVNDMEPLTEFKDVIAGHWAEGAIKIASEAGIMKGLPDGTFGVGRPVTREQLAVVVAALLKGVNKE